MMSGGQTFSFGLYLGIYIWAILFGNSYSLEFAINFVFLYAIYIFVCFIF